jgi:hypothetical protein
MNDLSRSGQIPNADPRPARPPGACQRYRRAHELIRPAADGEDRVAGPASPDASFLGQKAWEKDKRYRAPVGETFAPKQIIWSQVAKLDELGKFCCAQRPMLLAVA